MTHPKFTEKELTELLRVVTSLTMRFGADMFEELKRQGVKDPIALCRAECKIREMLRNLQEKKNKKS